MAGWRGEGVAVGWVPWGGGCGTYSLFTLPDSPNGSQSPASPNRLTPQYLPDPHPSISSLGTKVPLKLLLWVFVPPPTPAPIVEVGV